MKKARMYDEEAGPSLCMHFVFVLTVSTLMVLPPGCAIAQAADANAVATEQPAYPNIILIVADDFGYGDLGCYGAKKINTPNVDKLAADGLRFTDAYVASSLCSPSRYSILTGRYSWRTKLKTGVLKPFAAPLIEEGRTTLASLLNRSGYYTACVGKWHLGFDWALKDNAPADARTSVFDSWGTGPQAYIDFSARVAGGPLERGFDYFFGISGSNNMIPYVFIENEHVVEPPSVPVDFGPKTLRARNWDLRTLDQQLTEKAVAVIDGHFQGHREKPLFLYFATSAIHAPCLPSLTKGGSRAGLRGDMVQEFDLMVGKIVGALARHGALDNTLLIVTSDNGPLPGDPYAQVKRFRAGDFDRMNDLYQPYFSAHKPSLSGIGGQPQGWLTYDHDATAGLLGFKSDAWEGGLRVPFIVHWPRYITGGSERSQSICATDIMATVAAITGKGLEVDEGEDSYSLLPVFFDKEAPAPRSSLTLVAGRSGALTVRKGEWKFIEAVAPPDRSSPTVYPPPPNEFPGHARVDEMQLYDLSRDPGEARNLAKKMPEKIVAFETLVRNIKTHTKSEGN